MIIVSYTKIIETLLESLHVSMSILNARDPTLEYGSLAYRAFFEIGKTYLARRHEVSEKEENRKKLQGRRT